MERRGARPTLDVNGIWGGFQGEGSKTIIPAHAHAKVSCRLVADMHPDTTFARLRDYVMSIAPKGVEVSVTRLNDGDWVLMPIDHQATKAAAACLEEVFGEAPLYLHEGGSIPAAASFAKILAAPIVLLGFTQPDDQAHAPNESMRLVGTFQPIRSNDRPQDPFEAEALLKALTGQPLTSTEKDQGKWYYRRSVPLSNFHPACSMCHPNFGPVNASQWVGALMLRVPTSDKTKD